MDQVRSAQLGLLGGQVVVSREAIAHHIAAKGIPEQFDCIGRRSTQPLQKHRHYRCDHDPLPTAAAIRIASVRIAGGGASFIDVVHRLLTGKTKGLHGLVECCVQALADRCNRPTADLNLQLLIEQRLGPAETQREGTVQQTHQGTEPGPLTAGLHIRRQGGAGAGGAAWEDQPMHPMLDHQRCDWRILDHLMAQRLWINTG